MGSDAIGTKRLCQCAMPKMLNYRAALVLVSAVGLIEVITFLYVKPYNLESSNSLLIRSAIDFAVVFGIWVQSAVARYLGALWLLFVAASTFWPLAANSHLAASIPLFLFLIEGTISLVACVILIFSTTSAEEFSRKRKKTATD